MMAYQKVVMFMYEYYKDKLNSQGKQIYEGMLQNIGMLASVGFVELKGFFDGFVLRDAKYAYKALRLDRPEYFFLGHNLIMKYSSDGTLTIRHNLKYSKSHVIRMNRVLIHTVRELISGTENMSILDRERTIYIRVGKNFTYKESDNAHDLSGLLVYKDGVCESLAAMLVVAFREAGIPAIVVQGYGKREAHRWSKAWIDEVEYYLDVTWDMSKCKCDNHLKYFNLTSQQMSKDHQMVDIFTNAPLAM